MFCKLCGKYVSEDTVYCPGCGHLILTEDEEWKPKEKLGIGFGILSFFIPLVGLIIFIAYRKKHPQKASMAWKVALAGFLTQFAVVTILVCFFTGQLIQYLQGVLSSEAGTNFIVSVVVRMLLYLLF